MARKKQQKRIAVIDAETDPFVFGVRPEPFAWGFYDGRDYVQFWGDNCTRRLLDFLGDYDTPLVIYAHNGGKFDFLYFVAEGVFTGAMTIINSRIVKARLMHHEVRDSYAMIPVPLAAYNKDDIDYAKFARDVREHHKTEILNYLEMDCRYLHELVTAFITEFGLHLTIGGCALKTLKTFHAFEHGGRAHDATFRQYYFGGRVEYFEQGVLDGDFRVYDVNSMYPAVMRDFQHPRNPACTVYYSASIDRNGNPDVNPNAPVYFARIIASNRGCLPARSPDGSLTFNVAYGEFFACSHEIRAGCELGLIDIDATVELYIPEDTQDFAAYVDFCMKKKLDAEAAGDKAGRLFAKLLANNAYGKTAQNPDNFRDYQVKHISELTPDFLAEWECDLDYGDWGIWLRPSKMEMFVDVAIGASITSAARSVLLRALHGATRPIYCDTDSIICEGLAEELHATKIGAWKTEAEGVTAAIAGKKMYALFDKYGECVKYACKGVQISPTQIVDMCNGHEICYRRDAPNMKLDGSTKFIERRVKMIDKPK